MLISDIILLIVVYTYVVAIFVIAEKLLKNKPTLSRKFVHIMVGNMIFIMPFFSSSYIMVWFLTLPITIAVFLLTEYSPIKVKNSVTKSGYALGLFFYAAIWTLLILIFPNDLWIVGLAIAALVYGDGFASLIGAKFGKIKYNLTGDNKTLEGSLTMFVVVSVMSVFVWMFYYSLGYHMPSFNFVAILGISGIATFAEAITPGGADNISLTVVTAFCYYLMSIL